MGPFDRRVNLQLGVEDHNISFDCSTEYSKLGKNAKSIYLTEKLLMIDYLGGSSYDILEKIER